MEWDEVGMRSQGKAGICPFSHSHPRISARGFPGRAALTLLPLGPGVPGIPCRTRRTKQKAGFALEVLSALLSQHSQRIQACPAQIPHPSLPEGTGNQIHLFSWGS